MNEDMSDLIESLVWNVEHDQWSRGRVLALRDLIVDAVYGEHMGQLRDQAKITAYRGYLARVYVWLEANREDA